MKTLSDYYNEACQIFFAANPEYQQALDALTEQEAQHAGFSLADFIGIQQQRIYAAFLRQKQLDGIIFSIQLVETDKELALQAIEFYLRQQAEAQGLSFEAFCQKNQL